MAELVWQGKHRSGVGAEPRPPPPRCCTDEVHGVPDDPHGHNRLVLGDQAATLASWLAEFAGRVSLVYIDPPFETGGHFDFLASIPGAPEDAPRVAIHAYGDARGLDAWLEWFHATALVLGDLLVDGGGLYVHLDAHVAHYAKVVLDEVFGYGAFQREIIWRIGWVSGFKSRVRGWVRNHDTLLYYAKGGRARTFHKEYVPYPAGYVRRDGKPPRGRGYPIDDVWNGSDIDRLDSIQIMSFSGEKVGYPTQKNEALVSRVVRASSNPGDLVLDCFVGSGTTAVVAEKLGRRWLACDASPMAIHATRKRLLSLPEVRPFVVQSISGGSTTADADGVPSSEGDPGSPRRLSARYRVEGRRATIELCSFAVPAPARTTAKVAHWSQWIEGWCVDWDYQGGALRVGSRMWRSRRADLPLSATHEYGRAGRHVAMVKTFDVFGGSTTRRVELLVEG